MDETLRIRRKRFDECSKKAHAALERAMWDWNKTNGQPDDETLQTIYRNVDTAYAALIPLRWFIWSLRPSVAGPGQDD